MLEQHLEKLRSFHAAARERSLVKAGAALGLSQPAMTKNVRALEEILGCALLVRHRRGVELTRAGVELERFCDGLFAKTRDLEKRIRNTSELAGVVRIGTYETLGELFWPRALRGIGKRYPDLIVELITENPATIRERLDAGGIDLIVDAEPETSERLHSSVLYSDRFAVFCKKNSRLIGEEKIPISFVPGAYDRHRVFIDQHLRKAGISFELRYPVQSFTLARSLVLEDVCVGVLPLSLAAGYVARGILGRFGTREQQKDFGEHRICATCLDQSKDEPRIQALVAILKTMAKQA